MSDSIFQLLPAISDPEGKAALIAETILSDLPVEVALVARRCVILHWFDQSIIEALLQDTPLTKNEVREVYKQLVLLPFIESLPWGRAFQNLTREGLLKQYATSQPDLLKSAANLAASAYEVHAEDEKIAGEAFFCYIVAGKVQSSLAIRDKLLEDAMSREDWRYIANLLQLQEEAEQLPFVKSSPLTAQDLLLRGFVHQIQGKLEASLMDYSRAIKINPNNALAYISRGAIYAEQQQYKKALTDYNHALNLDSSNVHAYIGRGSIYKEQERYREALIDFDSVLWLDTNNITAYCNKGHIFNELGQYEEALAVFQQLLRLTSDIVNAYDGKGNALNKLGRFEEALAAYEEALKLDPYNADVYRGKGSVLSRLKRYEQASAAYEQARKLDPDIVEEEHRELIYLKSSSQQRREDKREVVSEIAERKALENDTSHGDVTSTSRRARVIFPSVFSQKKKLNQPVPRFIRIVNTLVAVLVVSVLVSSFIALHNIFNSTTGGGSTAHSGVMATPTNTATATPDPSPTPITETVVANFTASPNTVTTTHSYSGTVSISVSGVGQAAQTAYSDAFYIYTDNFGNAVTPRHSACWVLYIDDKPVDDFTSSIPAYTSSHSYSFTITAPGGTLTFGVCDSVTSDNTGSYTITVTQQR